MASVEFPTQVSLMADDEKTCCVLNKAHVELHGREPADAIKLMSAWNIQSVVCVCVCGGGGS